MNKQDILDYKDKAFDLARKGKRVAVKTAESIKNGIEHVSDKAVEEYEHAKTDMDIRRLSPVFFDDFSDENYEIPRMIRIVDYDKKHMDNKACEGSVGFETKTKHMKVLTLYSESAINQDLIDFYPGISETIYYADPCRPNHYICLDNYFDYLKKARVDELEAIAQDLGAKHVKITFKEEKKTFVSHKKKVSVAADAESTGDMGKEGSMQDYASMEVAADVSFTGSDTPIRPKPVYFDGESDIHALIRARINQDSKNPIKEKTYKIKYSNTSGINEKKAGEIDEALTQLKCVGSASVSSEAQKERRTILEYHIIF